MKNLVTCDKCKIIKPMKWETNYTREGSDGGSYEIPDDWKQLKAGVDEIDLCPSCSKAFEEWLNRDPNKVIHE